MQKFDERLNKFEKAIEMRRKKTKELELARLEGERVGEKKSHSKKKQPRAEKSQEIDEWERKRKDKMKKLENMRIDK